MGNGQTLAQLSGDVFLTDGGIETDLIFHRGFDIPEFASFVLHDDAITHQVRSHIILVFLRGGDSSKPQSRVRLIGAMQFPVTSLSIRRPALARASYPRPVN